MKTLCLTDAFLTIEVAVSSTAALERDLIPSVLPRQEKESLTLRVFGMQLASFFQYPY